MAYLDLGEIDKHLFSVLEQNPSADSIYEIYGRVLLWWHTKLIHETREVDTWQTHEDALNSFNGSEQQYALPLPSEYIIDNDKRFDFLSELMACAAKEYAGENKGAMVIDEVKGKYILFVAGEILRCGFVNENAIQQRGRIVYEQR